MSVWQTPQATRRTSTSPAFGSARSTSWTSSGRPNSSSTAARILILESVPELGRVCAAVDLLQALDLVDVVACLVELDPDVLPLPAVDVVLAGVVGGKREPLVLVVAVEQVAQVPRAVADVDVRVGQVGDAETAAAGRLRDALRRGRRQLHQPHGA